MKALGEVLFMLSTLIVVFVLIDNLELEETNNQNVRSCRRDQHLEECGL